MLEIMRKNGTVIFDGGMGTLLMKNGLKIGMRSDMMNIEHPDVVEKIHRDYVDAGSRIICTNSFSSCSETLKGTDVTAEEMIKTAVELAKRASNGRALTALDIGPVGEFMEPYGEMTYERAYSRFSEQAELGKKAGAELIAIETMMDIAELRAAIEASEKTGLDIFATMTFNPDGKTFTGCPVEEFAKFINDTPVAAAGINCSRSPEEMLPTAEKLAAVLKKPLIIKLNAGLPDGKTGEYSVSPEEFARQMLPYKALNVKVAGGCCGTTPEHIRALKEIFDELA